MAVQSQIISCPAGQWTSIAEYMERRQALMVQCPQVAVTDQVSATSLVAGGFGSVIGANVNRTALAFSTNTGSAGVTADWVALNFDAALAAVNDGIGLGGVTFEKMQYVVVTVGIQKEWFGQANGPTGFDVTVFESIATCEAIILGINTGVPSLSGPYGTVPVGIWQTPDLLSGPSEFRLNRTADYDLTIQAWFAWPVGSGTVSVQVYQSFDDAPAVPYGMYGTFEVGLPQLSPAGKRHLDRLRERLGDRGNPLWQP